MQLADHQSNSMKSISFLFFGTLQLAIELTASDENQVKAGPDRDKEKKRTRCASSTEA